MVKHQDESFESTVFNEVQQKFSNWSKLWMEERIIRLSCARHHIGCMRSHAYLNPDSSGLQNQLTIRF